ncbi:hypothetical protein [Sphingomicrobium nitratireducens]|uniref:hypothetical protein n=1 Tax=Sphingomicrobium nitratireducens TaxID=2964666 RepID=UPI0022405448|nr:hypothetical protein [Sphingomicrobium nitratireducens]
MKKVALTVSVLALGLAACEAKTDDAVENAAIEEAVENDMEAAGDAVENAVDETAAAAEAAGDEAEAAAEEAANEVDAEM